MDAAVASSRGLRPSLLPPSSSSSSSAASAHSRSRPAHIFLRANPAGSRSAHPPISPGNLVCRSSAMRHVMEVDKVLMEEVADLESFALMALSPLDGRYVQKVKDLSPFFSEYGLIRYRVLVEVKWLLKLSQVPEIKEVPTFSKDAESFLERIVHDFGIKDALEVKKIEKVTNHDVKAVEYFLKQKCKSCPEIAKVLEFFHFACTSEDINNLAHALMLKEGLNNVIFPVMIELCKAVCTMAKGYAHIPMLSRTHGQPASPTTLGKEMANFAFRFNDQGKNFREVKIYGKFSGAVGNYNAHKTAYSDINWPNIAAEFVKSLGLEFNPYVTQVTKAGEIGSSTMPHKVNPIDFENSEGNLCMANANLSALSMKLPISRMQRDLTDSTVLRNLGIGLGYSLVAYKSALQGIKKLQVNEGRLYEDLDETWEVLAEPIQTVMRRYNVPEPYEKLKELTRGRTVTKESIRRFIEDLDLPEEPRSVLLNLTPHSYIGEAENLAKSIDSVVDFASGFKI
ncbi:uncharacterized protein LOC109719709 isoform X2 [Ananas comosus]|uniref:Uncharacterized protein LOC109719709 isoform X2 n=1 Tax=Ananas comosus TaxID=4615 RepID=A0A6P5G133_ANACO|nr:uncharacterized protein LOC109719709 isoform X2 [Ananas comosus]